MNESILAPLIFEKPYLAWCGRVLAMRLKACTHHSRLRLPLLLIFTIYILCVVSLKVAFILCQIPVTVWGYVKYPDGSPAVGAKVTVVADSVTKTTTTNSKGMYKVDLTVTTIPVTVKVYAEKGDYTGKATARGEGVIRVDIKLEKTAKTPEEEAEKEKTPTNATIKPSGNITREDKNPTSLSISASKREFKVGEVATIKGYISPPMSAIIHIVIINPLGSKKNMTVKTNVNGSFSIELPLNTPGKWVIYAYYPGSQKFKPSKSKELILYVVKPELSKHRKSLTLILNVNAVNMGDKFQITIQGETKPRLSRAELDVYISLDSGRTWLYYGKIPISKGSFHFKFNVTVQGKILIKVVLAEGKGKYRKEAIKEITLAGIPKPLNATLVSRLSKENAILRQKINTLSNEVNNLKEEVRKLNSAVSKYRTLLVALIIVCATLSLLLSITLMRSKVSRRFEGLRY